MDFEKFKEDMIQKISNECYVQGTSREEIELGKLMKRRTLSLAEMVCDLIEEYDKRKQEE